MIESGRRTVAAGLALLLVSAFGVRWLSASSGPAWALKIVVPALAIGLLPGAVCAMAWRPRRPQSPTEFGVSAAGMSAVVVQLATILALTLHLSPSTVLGGAATLVAVGLLLQLVPAGAARPLLRVSWSEALFGLGLVGLSTLLYAQGSPWAAGEDYLHLGVIRRLSQLGTPAIDNIYFAPGVIYTYPFPALHYYMALVSSLGGADPAFVYHKLRFLWSPVAVVCVSVFATRVFASRSVGLACGFTALAFTATGSFASVPPLMWGQLAPVSHASDVAMGVVLPLAMTFTVGYLRGSGRRERRFFLAGTLGLVLTLSVVHIRELVQVLVYLLSFALFLSLSHRWVRVRARAWVLFGGSLAIAVAFALWHRFAVAHISSVVDVHRALLLNIVTSISPVELFGHQMPMMASFVAYYDLLFRGWNPVLIAMVPLVVRAFGLRPLVWLMATSVFVYLLIIRFPLVAAPYIYATYFEILFTPVRNVIFFLHVMAGATLYLVAQRLAGWPRLACAAAVVAAPLALSLLWSLPRDFLYRHQDALIVPVLITLGSLLWRSRRDEAPAAGSIPPDGLERRWWPWLPIACAAAAALVTIAVVWQYTATPARAIHVAWRPDVTETGRVFREFRFGLTNPERLGPRTWSYDLVDESAGNISALLRSRAIGDTQDIDRGNLRVSPEADEGDTMRWAGGSLPMLGLPSGLQAVMVALVGLIAFACRQMPPWIRWPTSRRASGAAGLIGTFAAVLVGAALATSDPQTSLLGATSAASTPEQLLSRSVCGGGSSRAVPYPPKDFSPQPHEMVSCPPPYALMQWFADNVPADSILAVDIWNQVPPSAFLPQQYLGWAGLDNAFLNPEQLFGGYLSFYHRALTAYDEQPFFNDKETPDERQDFVDRLAVTHVLVDPPNHAMMSRVLATSGYQVVYDRDEWAVYRVVRGPRG